VIALLISPLFFARSWSFPNSCSYSILLQVLFQLLTSLILTLSFLYSFQSLFALSIMLSTFHLLTTLNNSAVLLTPPLFTAIILLPFHNCFLSHSFDFLFLALLFLHSLASLFLTHAHLSLASQFFTAIARNCFVIPYSDFSKEVITSYVRFCV